jgi:hypothetical protein
MVTTQAPRSGSGCSGSGGSSRHYLVFFDLLLAGDGLQTLNLVQVEILVFDQVLLQEAHG